MTGALQRDAEIALDQLFAPWNRSDAPGLVVGVARHGVTLYRRGFGLASLEQCNANTPVTRMRIASVSKQFTCMAALLLHEAGVLDADAGIRTYVKELPPQQDNPTLRQLMSHTGGVRCFLDLSLISNGLSPIPPAAAHDYQLLQSGGNFTPGAQMIYCNGGYQLLSIAIERATGQMLDEVLAERIFRPLGMGDSVLWRSDHQFLPGLAALHFAQPGGGWRRGLFPSDAVGDGGVVSTIDDLLRWCAQLRAEKKIIGGAATWASLMQTPRLAGGNVSTYGSGLIHTRVRGLRTLQHSGAVLGGTAQLLTVPEHGLDLVILANRSDVNAIELSTRMLEIMLPEQLAPAPPPVPVRPAALGTYYCAAQRISAALVDAGGRLALAYNQGGAIPLIDDEQQGWRIDLPGAGDVAVLLEPTAGDAPAGEIRIDAAGVAGCFRRLADDAPSAADMAPRLAGDWRCDDLAASGAIRLDGGTLVLELHGSYGRNSYSLTPLADGVLAMRPLLLPLPINGTVVIEGDMFWLNTSRSRNLLFRR